LQTAAKIAAAHSDYDVLSTFLIMT